MNLFSPHLHEQIYCSKFYSYRPQCYHLSLPQEEDRSKTADDDSLYDASDPTEGTELVEITVKQELSQEDRVRMIILVVQLLLIVPLQIKLFDTLLSQYDMEMEYKIGSFLGKEKQKEVQSVIEPGQTLADLKGLVQW